MQGRILNAVVGTQLPDVDRSHARRHPEECVPQCELNGAFVHGEDLQRALDNAKAAHNRGPGQGSLLSYQSQPRRLERSKERSKKSSIEAKAL